MAVGPSTIGDFSVLPISIPPLPSFPRPATHYVYLRRNAPKIPTATDSRSLFLTNVPIDSTELHLRHLIASLVGNGRFESATFEDEKRDANPVADAQPVQAARLLAAHSKKRKREGEDAERAREEEAARLPSTWTRPLRRSGGTAVVLLADAKSVEQVLKAVAKVHRSKKYPTWGVGEVHDAKRIPPLGSVWLKAHNRLSYPDKDALQAAVDAFSALFTKREQEAAEIAKRLRNEPDEDGFVTVTRGGRNAPASRNEAEEAKRKMLERQEKKREEMANFYRFQLRERQKEEQAELLKRFEEDRKKISAMREKRGKFVPES
ncbi:ribosomal RNA-processing protein 7-domain-containing protein [Echria macrotheca]|uniref:Ribosomal RNA-processing protein 7-domain-containing protein n=1 Tax=Echria macrotheca TaxID=438768 RepID=A0AAJ0B1G9_9PEZI|nr:ribosomal RNA-processing protein 7-domain-containing protein [Echria macrotheca]